MEAARPAAPADVAEVVRLAEEARRATLEQRGGALWLTRDGRATLPADALEALLTDASHRVVVGTIEDAVVGYAVAASDGVVATIEELYVEPAAREVGVGEALVEHLLAWARSEGCTGIDGFALPGDRATKNMFERFGMTARAIIVHKNLESA